MEVESVKTGVLEENCYVLSKEDECLIIDPGDDFSKIKKLVGKRKVLGVLITHYHFDHIGALDDVLINYKTSLIDYKSYEYQNIGPFSFEIIKTPGHKDDAVTYYFKDEKIMFVGDFIFKGTIGRCDLKGGNINDMKRSINLIKKYDKKIKLYPGHGDYTTLEYEMNNNLYMR